MSMRRWSRRAISRSQNSDKRVADRQLPSSGLVDQAVELVAQRSQLQPAQHGDQMVVPTHQKPPPTAVS